jgi:hypothetical protein
MNLFRKAIQNLDAHWRRPAYPLDFKLVREALVEGEDLADLAKLPETGELIGLYEHLISVFFPRLAGSTGYQASRTASAILLYTMYLRKGGYVENYQLIDTLRTSLPGTEEAKDVNELNILRVRLSYLRGHLQETGWSRKDVKTSWSYGVGLSPALQEAVDGVGLSPALQEAVDREVKTFKVSQRPSLNSEQREDAEKTVLGALEPLDDNPAKRICDALAAKGYLTYG